MFRKASERETEADLWNPSLQTDLLNVAILQRNGPGIHVNGDIWVDLAYKKGQRICLYEVLDAGELSLPLALLGPAFFKGAAQSPWELVHDRVEGGTLQRAHSRNRHAIPLLDRTDFPVTLAILLLVPWLPLAPTLPNKNQQSVWLLHLALLQPCQTKINRVCPQKKIL